MHCYRIKNWNDIYENNRTREIKKLGWFPVPIKLDGDGYTLIMAESDGVEIFGSWIACGEVAASCEPRGTLLRHSGIPHSADSLSRITRIPIKIINRMLSFCLEKCKWLELIDLETGCIITAPSCDYTAPSCVEQNRIEQKEQKELFNTFRKKYPGTKRGNETEFNNFIKKNKNWKNILPILADTIDKQIENKKTLKEIGKFVPEWKHLQTWINKKCWEEENDLPSEEKWFND
jgi:hypothetical protein